MPLNTPRSRILTCSLTACATVAIYFAVLAARAQQVDNLILKAEAERVAVVEKIKPTVVAVFARGGQGGGSGVLISEDGYALTNYHVTAPAGPLMQCGLP